MVNYDKTLDPKSYLEIITGNSYYLPESDEVEQIKAILEENGFDDIEEHKFKDIKIVSESEAMFVLVEIKNRKLHWFKVPSNITAADIDNYFAFEF